MWHHEDEKKLELCRRLTGVAKHDVICQAARRAVACWAFVRSSRAPAPRRARLRVPEVRLANLEADSQVRGLGRPAARRGPRELGEREEIRGQGRQGQVHGARGALRCGRREWREAALEATAPKGKLFRQIVSVWALGLGAGERGRAIRCSSCRSRSRSGAYRALGSSCAAPITTCVLRVWGGTRLQQNPNRRPPWFSP